MKHKSKKFDAEQEKFDVKQCVVGVDAKDPDGNDIGGLAIFKAKTLGELILQRIAHIKTIPHYDDNYDGEYQYLNLLYQMLISPSEPEPESDCCDMLEIDSGIMFHMWANVLNVGQMIREFDSNFSVQHFARGMYEQLVVVYYG